MMHASPGSAAATHATPNARLERQGGSLVAVLEGEWTLEHAPPRFVPDGDAALAGERVRQLSFDATALGRWDSSLLVFLQQCERYCESARVELDTAALPGQVTRLLALARAVPDREAGEVPAAVPPLARLGLAALRLWDGALAMAAFAGEVAIAVTSVARGRVHMRWRAFWVVVQSNGAGALPIVTLIALLVGVIIAFLGVVVLKRFGAGYYASYLVGFGVLREMGALMTGIIMAGRTGAAFAAELGSMKITEELDAYTTLGVSPVEHLVLPRVLGLFVMMPLLTIYADAVGIGGGMLVAVGMLDLSPTQFAGGLLAAVTLTDALLGVFKGTIFGLIIGLAGCLQGLRTGSDAGAVGRSATSAVVLGITLIILANAVIDWLAALLQI